MTGHEETYAAVIVDVPVNQTDRPFDYRIPAELQDQVDVGCRVRVPFGPRTVQGYVVRLHTQPNVEKMKPIREVVDIVPPLNDELVELAKWMHDYYFCRTATALEAMIPSVLKARYERILKVPPAEGDGPDARQRVNQVTWAEQRLIEAVNQSKNGLALAQAEKIEGVSRSLIRKLIKANRLELEERVRDRTTHRKVMWVIPDAPEVLHSHLAKLSPRAHKQSAVLRYFMESGKPVSLTQVLSDVGVTRDTVMRLVKQGVLQTEMRETYRNPFTIEAKRDHPLSLTDEQQTALNEIVQALQHQKTETFLLHGVTGSGKTEIYLQAIASALAKGREAIVLVPEISLTAQMVHRFKARFGDEVSVLHSRLSAGERYDEWRKILYGKVRVAIGARSAIFAPFHRLGLIVVDEEHETSYKQDDNPRYHVRDIALRRSAYHDAVTVLGSATPSVETYYRARTHAIRYLTLEKRVKNLPFPHVDVVDMRQELDAGNRTMFSRDLKTALEACISRGEQAVLFLNRRGHSNFVLCRQCGHSVDCPHCDISLTYHRSNRLLRCHYCGYAEPIPDTCPDCGSEHIRYFGTGTQRVEQELAKRFPGLRVIRMDVDTTTRKGSHEKMLTAFGRKQADVLLGTQMIAKGLDFPDVTLVGVIAADTVLGLPDFRAAERTFQLLMQVGGRAGRARQPGRVIIQTYNPDHYSIDLAARYEVETFYRQECRSRIKGQYPPFRALTAITFSHPSQALVMKASHRMTQVLKQQIGEHADVLGPVRASIPRIKDRYRMQSMVKYENDHGLKSAFEQAQHAIQDFIQKDGLRVRIDRDPYIIL